ncbi:MAG: MBL fold metallo-hydrolase [Syntrophomonadaceae bacterium]|nr:MBL fold metallo-hydrolase [Syntrophomonadaceae bacterium]
MIKVHDRVYLVGGYGLSRPEDCLVYLLRGDGELALIDCGVGGSVDAIMRNVASLDLEPQQVKYVVATHGHIDHIGGLAQLKEKGVLVVAHREDLPAITRSDSRLNAADMYGIKYRPVEVDLVVAGEAWDLPVGGQTLHLLHTPGHTPGSMAGYVDTDGLRILFGQDIHGPFSPAWKSNLKQWRRSMERLIALKADILCEGHHGVIEGREKVEQFIRRHLQANPG